MSLTSKLLDFLVCPQCKGKLAQVEGGRGLLCHHCQLKYPVRDGIPVMLVEEAVDMRSVGAASTPQVPSGQAPSGKMSFGKRPPAVERANIFSKKVRFKVIGGPDEGLEYDLDINSCRAMGRAIGDPTKTSIINVDWALSIDEETKGLILQYISQQFRKPAQQEQALRSNELGAFRRNQDVVFKDQTLSRLHAMIFFDEIGVGILDLVSKNGTFVNGQEIESCLLKKGDTIELGESKIVFEG